MKYIEILASLDEKVLPTLEKWAYYYNVSPDLINNYLKNNQDEIGYFFRDCLLEKRFSFDESLQRLVKKSILSKSLPIKFRTISFEFNAYMVGDLDIVLDEVSDELLMNFSNLNESEKEKLINQLKMNIIERIKEVEYSGDFPFDIREIDIRDIEIR